MTAVPPSDQPTYETWFSALRSSLFIIRVPIAMAAVTVVTLTMPAQVQEIYATLARDRPESSSNFHYHWILAIASLVGLSLVLWQVARGLSYDFPRRYGDPHPLARFVLRWTPRLLIAVPLLGAAAGLWLSGAEDLVGADPLLDDFVVGVDRLRRDFANAMYICCGLAAGLFVIAVLFEWLVGRKNPERVRKIAAYSNWVLFPAVAAVSVAILLWDQIRMPQILGAVPLFALWMSILALVVGLLARFSLFAVPLLALLVAYGLGIEYFKLADNHEIRSSPKKLERLAVEDAFKQWLAKRKDLPAYQAAQRPYPVYIVAAEGGGLYAAYLTARFLARMQDLCPSFSQHIFTISSVSGGSLGAAVFAGLVSGDPKLEQPAPCLAESPRFGPMERQAHTILSRDFLSPAVWGGLFPDFLQRFIPHPFPVLDRAVYLERAFENAWPKTGANPMTQSFFDLCGSDMARCLGGATPMLSFNVTNVETGLQLVLSPVDLQDVGAYRGSLPLPSRKIYDFFELAGMEPFDLRLSTAVGLSARFPWISPPGWYRWGEEGAKDEPKDDSKQATKAINQAKKGKARFTFLDGGFVDNSGVATALNIAQHLDALNPRPNVEFRILMISALWAPIDRLWIQPPVDSKSGEVMPPITTAISARQGRGFKTQFDAALEAKPGLSVSEIGFYYGFQELPLGWQLSPVSRRYIRLFRGEPQRCALDSEENYAKYTGRSVESHAKAEAAYIRRADCVVARIKNELSPAEPRRPPPEWPPINPTR